MEKLITNHEWRQWRGPIYHCPHCDCFYHELHVSGRMYKPKGMSKPTLKEPPCITRKIQNPDQEAGGNG